MSGSKSTGGIWGLSAALNLNAPLPTSTKPTQESTIGEAKIQSPHCPEEGQGLEMYTQAQGRAREALSRRLWGLL